MTEDDGGGGRGKLIIVRVKIAMHRVSKVAHKCETPGHFIYFSLLGLGYHEAYVMAALVMAIVVAISMLPEGGPPNA